MFLNNRYHDSTVGIFVSVDPLVGQTGMPYLYANGNPSTLSDSSGLVADCELQGTCAGEKYPTLADGELNTMATYCTRDMVQACLKASTGDYSDIESNFPDRLNTDAHRYYWRLLGMILNEGAIVGTVDLVLDGSFTFEGHGEGAAGASWASGYDGSLIVQASLYGLGVPGYDYAEALAAQAGSGAAGEGAFYFSSGDAAALAQAWDTYMHTASGGAPPGGGGFSQTPRNQFGDGGAVGPLRIQPGVVLSAAGTGQSTVLFGAGADVCSRSTGSVPMMNYRVVAPLTVTAGYAASTRSSSGGATRLEAGMSIDQLVAAGILEPI